MADEHDKCTAKVVPAIHDNITVPYHSDKLLQLPQNVTAKQTAKNLIKTHQRLTVTGAVWGQKPNIWL